MENRAVLIKLEEQQVLLQQEISNTCSHRGNDARISITAINVNGDVQCNLCGKIFNPQREINTILVKRALLKKYKDKQTVITTLIPNREINVIIFGFAIYETCGVNYYVGVYDVADTVLNVQENYI